MPTAEVAHISLCGLLESRSADVGANAPPVTEMQKYFFLCTSLRAVERHKRFPVSAAYLTLIRAIKNEISMNKYFITQADFELIVGIILERHGKMDNVGWIALVQI
ncbi:hypothetical protein [Pantoea dispersa]|uniref:hypothetical protein n=1 Tax=Pantoea dispersa TaxID=59814 RepID=UPI000FDAA852|nr:hypothetical protein [Pantoea dispersa]RVU72142.1 hypothetical protein EKH82_23385 [Pantoea dispersa]